MYVHVVQSVRQKPFFEIVTKQSITKKLEEKLLTPQLASRSDMYTPPNKGFVFSVIRRYIK